MGMKGTKWTLFTISVDLFAEKGYDTVSVRDIAKAAGIKAASIYNHFKSKDEILETIYDYYDYHYSYFMPPIDRLLDYVGKEPPRQTLERALFRFDPSIQDTMDKIFLIASVRLYCDTKAQDIIFKNIFVLAEERISLIFDRMLALDLIEPLDTNSFILTLTSLCHSSALRMQTRYPIQWEVWVRSVEMLYEQVKEVKKTPPLM